MSDTQERLVHVLKTAIGGEGFLDHEKIARILAREFTFTDKPDLDNMVVPLSGLTPRWGDLSHDSSSIEPHRGEREVVSIEQANIVCSDIKDDFMRAHQVVLDIDWPVKVVESSPGKSHLYIDKPVSWTQLVMLMSVLVELDLVEEGYMFASIERGYTSVRVPWALKHSGVSIPEPPK